jgi:hypothetical protein
MSIYLGYKIYTDHRTIPVSLTFKNLLSYNDNISILTNKIGHIHESQSIMLSFADIP